MEEKSPPQRPHVTYEWSRISVFIAAALSIGWLVLIFVDGRWWELLAWPFACALGVTAAAMRVDLPPESDSRF